MASKQNEDAEKTRTLSKNIWNEYGGEEFEKKLKGILSW